MIFTARFPVEGTKADKAIAIIYDEATGSVLFTEGVRQDMEMAIPTALLTPTDVSKLHAYLVFCRPPTEGTGELGQVSNTAYSKVLVSP